MMAFFGVGAIIGVYLMQELAAQVRRRRKSVFVCTVLYGVAMLVVAGMPNIPVGCAAMFVAGFNWVIVPTNFNIATQLAVPAWIKGRRWAVYVLVLWGSMSLGSIDLRPVGQHHRALQSSGALVALRGGHRRPRRLDRHHLAEAGPYRGMR